jgi:hypothetical protein
MHALRWPACVAEQTERHRAVMLLTCWGTPQPVMCIGAPRTSQRQLAQPQLRSTPVHVAPNFTLLPGSMAAGTASTSSTTGQRQASAPPLATSPRWCGCHPPSWGVGWPTTRAPGLLSTSATMTSQVCVRVRVRHDDQACGIGVRHVLHCEWCMSMSCTDHLLSRLQPTHMHLLWLPGLPCKHRANSPPLDTCQQPAG